MNGFYITGDEADGVGCLQLQRLAYQSFCELHELAKNTIYLFDGAPGAQILEAQGCTLCAVGVLVHQQTWGRGALSKIMAELAGGRDPDDMARSLRGQFILLWHTPHETILINDAFAAVPVYELKKNHEVHLSNILTLLPRFNRVTWDVQSVAEFLSLDYCLEATLFREVSRVARAQVIRLNIAMKRSSYGDPYSDLTFGKYREVREVAALVNDALVENLSFLRPVDRIFADLTGGFDTRTVAVLLKHLGLSFSTGICGEQVLGEASLAAEVGKTLKVPFHPDFRIGEQNVFRRTAETHFSVAATVPLLYHSTELIHYYEKIQECFDIHLTGLAGTEIFTLHHPIRKTNLLSPKADLRGIVERGFRYFDVLPDDVMTRRQYYDGMEAKVATLLAGFSSNRFYDVVTYLALATYISAHHCTLQGVHDCFVPVYTPFLERNMVRLLVQCVGPLKHEHQIQRTLISQLNREVSLIETSHGYTAQSGFEPMRDLTVRARRRLKEAVRRTIYHNEFSRRLLRGVGKGIGARSAWARYGVRELADVDRRFWIEEVRSMDTANMEIMGMLDGAKLRQLWTDPRDCNALLAKVVYLERLTKAYRVSVGK
jgi:hypothetical protein